MHHEIQTWLLILTLFFPRIGLILGYASNAIPANPFPFWADFFMALFLPRVLMLMYIVINQGFDGWFILHCIGLIIAWGFSILRVSK